MSYRGGPVAGGGAASSSYDHHHHHHSNHNNNNNNNTSSTTRTWQPTNNRRTCTNCHRLESTCDCQHQNNNNNNSSNFNNNPDRIRENLNQVAQQTPFARSKHARQRHALFELLNEGRHRIFVARENGLAALTDRMLREEEMIYLCEAEQKDRYYVRKRWVADFQRYETQERFHFNYASLRAMERTMRRAVVEDYHETSHRIRHDADNSLELVQLIDSEDAFRLEIETAEYEAASFLYSEYAFWLARQAQQFALDCDELQRVYMHTREEILHECSAMYRQLMNAHAVGTTLAREHVVERDRFLDGYHSSLRQLEVQERTERQQQRRQFKNECHEIEATLAYQRQDRAALLSAEATHRSQLRAEAVDEFHALVDFEASRREQLLEHIDDQEAERQLFLSDAVVALHDIAEEEDERREHLAAVEEHQRELRRHWVQERALARERLISEAVRCLRAIESEELTDRTFAEQRMEDGAGLVEMRVEANEAERLELEETEYSTRCVIANGCSADLRRLHLMMNEHESQVYRLVGSRAAQRANIEQLEAELRRDVQVMEDHGRCFLADERERLAGEYDELCERALAELAAFARNCEQELFMIMDERDSEFEEFEIVFEEEAISLIALEQSDTRNHLFDQERHYRNQGQLVEFQERSRVMTLMASELRNLGRAARDQAEQERTLVCEDEALARDAVIEEAADHLAEVLAWSRRGVHEAGLAERARVTLEFAEQHQMHQRAAAHLHQQHYYHTDPSSMMMFEDPLTSHPLVGMEVLPVAGGGAYNYSPSPSPDNHRNDNHHRNHRSYSSSNDRDHNGNSGENHQRARSVSLLSAPTSTAAFSDQVASANPETNSEVTGRLSLNEVRRSVSVAPCDGERALKVNYLSTLLGRDDIDDRLDDDQLNLLVRLLERSAEWRAQRENACAETEAKMHAKEKELARWSSALDSKLESLEYHERKLREDGAKFETQLAAEKERVQRTRKQVRIEEERLREITAEVDKRKKRNEMYRDALHEKYNGNSRSGSNNSRAGGGRRHQAFI